MISDYVKAAMHLAKYELLEEDGGFFGEVPILPGVWANADTLEQCRDELSEAIESWIIIKLRHNDNDFPLLAGIDLNPQPIEQEVA